MRDTINVCFLGLSAVSATALVVTQTASAAPELWVLAATAPLVVLGNLAGRPIFGRLVRSGDYERVLTGVLLVAVTAGLMTTVL